MARPYNFVNFVSGSKSLSSWPKKCKGPYDGDNESMSGEEAKLFYESVISLSSTSSHRDDGIRTGSSRRNLMDGSVENFGSRRKLRSHHEVVIQESTSPNDTCSSQNRKETKRRKRRRSTLLERLINEFLRNAQNGNLKRLKELVRDEELDIDATDSYSWTGLMCAAQGGHAHVVKFLLEHGATWENKRDANGRNALDLAQLSGHQDIVTLFKQQKEGYSCQKEVAPYISDNNGRKAEKFWCTVCQQEFADSQKTHTSSTVHLFNCQHKPKKTFYYIPEGNVGYQMMLKSGWKEDEGLGPEGDGRKFPVKTVLKRDRLGLGINTNKGARVTHFGPGDASAVKRQKSSKKKPEERPVKMSKKEKRAQKESERMWEKNLRMYMNRE